MAQVKIYSTATCPYCIMAKKYFKEKNIEFDNFDVGENQNKAKEMIEKSGQMGVPVIEINGKIIIGFNQEEIEEALKQ